jgi:centractin
MQFQFSRVSRCLTQSAESTLLEGALAGFRFLSYAALEIRNCTYRDVTDHLQLLLRKAGHHLHTTAEFEVVRTIKEKSCYIALNPQKEEKESANRPEDFKLPDGNTIQVRGCAPERTSVINRPLYLAVQLGSERFRAPEILFNPELIGQEYAGVHQVVVDAINRVDLDLRKSLFSNIVLSGGSTLCRGDIDEDVEEESVYQLPSRLW